MAGKVLVYYGFSFLLALIPVLVWLKVFFKKNQRYQFLIFLTGVFSVGLLVVLHYFLNFFPQFDIVNFLQANIGDQNINYVILFVAVGVTEEFVKQALLRFLDRHYLLIKTINDSIQLSVIAALGFSFAENILYIYSIWMNTGIQELFAAYLFRSIFTTCAHIIFSGFFGYYYGIAKFSLDMRSQLEWKGEKMVFNKILARITGKSRSEVYKMMMIIKGFLIAMVLHAVFDLLLQFNQIEVVIPFVAFGYLWLRLLLRRRAGKLILIDDIEGKKYSSMAKKDEDVVIELVGMWFNEKRYVDVIHICERLLERDPDNKVVQLFRAHAVDKMDQKNIYRLVLQKLFPIRDQTMSLEQFMKMKGKK